MPKPTLARIHRGTPRTLARLARVLRAGELVAVPTETVYGLAANALDPRACRKIFRAKARPTTDPLIVHIHSRDELATLARPNAGTLQGGAWVWDHTAHLPWEALYSANYSALPLPRDQDLDDITLPTGVSIRVIEPCMSYALGYNDGERLKASLRFDGVMPPEPLKIGRAHV